MIRFIHLSWFVMLACSDPASVQNLRSFSGAEADQEAIGVDADGQSAQEIPEEFPPSESAQASQDRFPGGVHSSGPSEGDDPPVEGSAPAEGTTQTSDTNIELEVPAVIPIATTGTLSQIADAYSDIKTEIIREDDASVAFYPFHGLVVTKEGQQGPVYFQIDGKDRKDLVQKLKKIRGVSFLESTIVCEGGESYIPGIYKVMIQENFPATGNGISYRTYKCAREASSAPGQFLAAEIEEAFQFMTDLSRRLPPIATELVQLALSPPSLIFLRGPNFGKGYRIHAADLTDRKGLPDALLLDPFALQSHFYTQNFRRSYGDPIFTKSRTIDKKGEDLVLGPAQDAIGETQRVVGSEVADIDGNGLPEILMLHGSNQLSILYAWAEDYQRITWQPPEGYLLKSLQMIDTDGDGLKNTVLFASKKEAEPSATAELYVFLQAKSQSKRRSGTDLLGFMDPIRLGRGPETAQIGQAVMFKKAGNEVEGARSLLVPLEQEGKVMHLDIPAIQAGSADVQVFLDLSPAKLRPQILVASDLNKDGIDDLVVIAQAEGENKQQTHLFLQNDRGLIGKAVKAFAMPFASQHLQVMDVNADGFKDLIFRSETKLGFLHGGKRKEALSYYPLAVFNTIFYATKFASPLGFLGEGGSLGVLCYDPSESKSFLLTNGRVGFSR